MEKKQTLSTNPHQNLPAFRRRKLKRGETATLDQLGLPSFSLTGSQQEVFAYTDGRIVPIIQRPSVLLKAIFLHLALENHAPLSPDELKFLRKYLNKTQEEFAAIAGYRREVINKYESGREKLTIQNSNNIRLQVLLFNMAAAKGKNTKPNSPVATLEALSAAFANALHGLPKNLSIVRKDPRHKYISAEAY